jgi:hypothetical protein
LLGTPSLLRIPLFRSFQASEPFSVLPLEGDPLFILGQCSH